MTSLISPSSAPLSATLAARVALGDPVALVTVAEARGSTPREAGASMAVGADWQVGTVGGGRLEHLGLETARRLLVEGGGPVRLDVPLGPAVGQCCGGHVVLMVERVDEAVLHHLRAAETTALAGQPWLMLFGAGHVGKAVARAVAPLPLRLVWLDSRASEFPPDPPADADIRIATDLPAQVALAPPTSGYLVMTHNHDLDFAITAQALQRTGAAYVGLIGSHTKRQRFSRWYQAQGLDPAHLRRLVCPIGAGLSGDKRPEVIAALTTAEVLVALMRRAPETTVMMGDTSGVTDR
ncbi:xanthine dehydrogenase accessory protein XdhC [Nitrospirillum iridis]|uniref:Xanthine dehydrogenase accessory factor n=1 Tax=Nitrospirillum iridis TaxID=765888 RepID=A0A7X0AZU9_9PROT|nr:xanthine dehydrogenase accessory protein XdhC [Nitrospirillum iridis]MBB6252797.1 xanthine dehydrogenase accessory factor [Nitrospirillum iridis]